MKINNVMVPLATVGVLINMEQKFKERRKHLEREKLTVEVYVQWNVQTLIPDLSELSFPHVRTMVHMKINNVMVQLATVGVLIKMEKKSREQEEDQEWVNLTAMFQLLARNQ